MIRTKDAKAQKTEKILSSILFPVTLILVFCGHIFRVHDIQMPIILADEYGSIANAAYLLGLDWSDVISHVGYYSFGGSLIYIPIFALANSAEHVYQAITVTNALMFCVFDVFIYLALRRLYSDRPRCLCMTLSCAVSLYTSYITYGYTGMYETALAVTFAAAVWAIASYGKTHKVRYLYIFTLLLGYMLMCHMRTLGVICAAVLLLFVLTLAKQIKWKHFIISMALLGAMAALFYILKDYFYSHLWLDGAPYKQAFGDGEVPNTMGSQFEKLDLLLSAQGIKNIIKLCIGQSFYMVTTTLLTGGLFLWLAVRKLIGWLRSKKFSETDAVFCVFMFVLLSYLAQLAISCITFVNIIRMDNLFYGRYTEYIFGPMAALALMQLTKEKVHIWESIFVGAVYLAHAKAAGVLNERMLDRVQGNNIVSITGLSWAFDGKLIDVSSVAFPVFFSGLVISAAAISLRYFYGKGKVVRTVLTVFLSTLSAGMGVVFFMTATAFADDYIIPLNKVHMNYQNIANEIIAGMDENSEKQVVYYQDPQKITLENMISYELLQFGLWDISIKFEDIADIQQADADILITDKHIEPWEYDLFGKYDIICSRGDITVWQRVKNEPEYVLTLPATMYGTLCTGYTDWDEGTFTSDGRQGALIANLQMEADPGVYTVTYDIKVDDFGTADRNDQIAKLIFSDDTGVVRTKTIRPCDVTLGERVSVSFEMNVREERSDQEWRLNVSKNVLMTIYQVKIEEKVGA